MIVRTIVRHIDVVVALTLLALWMSLVGVASATGRQGGHPMRGNAADDCAPSSAVCEKPDR